MKISIKEMSRLEGRRQYTVLYTSDRGYTAQFRAVVSPTGDDEIASLASFSNILSLEKNKASLKAIMSEIAKVTGKHLFIYDVYKQNRECLDLLDPVYVQPYESTNGSSMIIGLIDTNFNIC